MFGLARYKLPRRMAVALIFSVRAQCYASLCRLRKVSFTDMKQSGGGIGRMVVVYILTQQGVWFRSKARMAIK
jgi:hypothetical protein